MKHSAIMRLLHNKASYSFQCVKRRYKILREVKWTSKLKNQIKNTAILAMSTKRLMCRHYKLQYFFFMQQSCYEGSE